MTIVVGARPALAALSAMPARSCLRPAFVGLRPCRRSLASTARRALPEYRGSLPNRIAIERRPASEVLGAAGVAIEEDDGVSMPAQRSRRALLWPAAFAVGLIGGSFALAAWQTNVDSDRRIRALRESGTRIQLAGWLSRDRAGAAVGIDRALYATRQQEVAAWCKQAYKSFASAPEGLRNVALALLDRWARMDESRRTAYGIVAIAGVVWLGWKTPPLRNLMRRHFLDWPASGRAHTLLTTVFSHSSFLHLAFNSVALLSFGPLAAQLLTVGGPAPDMPTSTPRYQFLAFFIGAGVFASLSSQSWSVLVKVPQVLRATGGLLPRTLALRPSLGMSGAIYATFVAVALIQLIFLPGFPFEIGTGLKFMLAFDLAGLLIPRLTMFDHAAHLGGALFGWLYFSYGVGGFHALRAWLRRVSGSSPPPKALVV